MPAAIIAAITQIAVAAIPWIGKRIDKMLSEKKTPTFKRWNKNVTIESVAKWGKKKGIVMEVKHGN